jgi:AcrR family transcriptional regulator
MPDTQGRAVVSFVVSSAVAVMVFSLAEVRCTDSDSIDLTVCDLKRVGTVPGPRKPYDSSLRAEQTILTRRRVLEAACEQFVERGYAQVTIASIARQAGVARETVYKTFGSKADLLKAAYDVAVAGDDDPTPLLGRPEVTELLDSGDLQRVAGAYGRITAGIALRVAPLVNAMAAAGSHPELKHIVARMKDERLRGTRALFRRLCPGAPPAALTEEVEAHWALNSPEVALLLLRDRGWSADQYARWLARQTVHQVESVRSSTRR